MTGYEKWVAIGKAMKAGKPVVKSLPVKDYSSCTLAELHALRDKATGWLKDNIEHPLFDEANKRYMAIEGELQLKEVENIFGAEK